MTPTLIGFGFFFFSLFFRSLTYGLCWTQVVFLLDISENEKGSTTWQSYATMPNQANLCSSLYASDYGVVVRAKTS